MWPFLKYFFDLFAQFNGASVFILLSLGIVLGTSTLLAKSPHLRCERLAFLVVFGIFLFSMAVMVGLPLPYVSRAYVPSILLFAVAGAAGGTLDQT